MRLLRESLGVCAEPTCGNECHPQPCHVSDAPAMAMLFGIKDSRWRCSRSSVTAPPGILEGLRGANVRQ